MLDVANARWSYALAWQTFSFLKLDTIFNTLFKESFYYP